MWNRINFCRLKTCFQRCWTLATKWSNTCKRFHWKKTWTLTTWANICFESNDIICVIKLFCFIRLVRDFVHNGKHGEMWVQPWRKLFSSKWEIHFYESSWGALWQQIPVGNFQIKSVSDSTCVVAGLYLHSVSQICRSWFKKLFIVRLSTLQICFERVWGFLPKIGGG